MEENRTLIIVDDEPDTLNGYVEFLTPKPAQAPRRSSRTPAGADSGGTPPGSLPSGENYQLLLAKTGEEALALVKKELNAGRRVAGGFFDVKLGAGLDGLTTIREIQRLDPEIHCAVVTAYQDRTVEEIHSLFGEEFKDQWDFLNKPFTRGEIVQKARQMIAAWNRKKRIELLHEQLVRSERMAGIAQVARGIGHEFGNILLRVIGKTDLALASSDVSKIHDHLKVVMTASERAAVIVKNLQAFSKLEPIFKSGRISESVNQAAVLLNHELTKFSVELEKKVLSDLEVQLDVGALAQVFLNLLINATHAMPKGGTILLTIEDLTLDGVSGVAARVKDHGGGIAPENLGRIFDYGFTTKGSGGSGLGLSISKEIVESHSGKLLVRSELGKGSEFTVWVPHE